MPEERFKHWQLTQERAMEVYETIQESLEPANWEIWVESKGEKHSLEDFKKAARKCLSPWDVSFKPQQVARDSLAVLDSLDTAFANIKQRLEETFKGILIVNDDMNEFINKIEGEVAEESEKAARFEKENRQLQERLARVEEDLRIKNEGIEPLADLLRIRVQTIIAHFEAFKKYIGDEKKMAALLPMFQKEADTTIKLLKLRQDQLLSTSVADAPPARETAQEKDEFLPADDAQGVDDNVEFKNPQDEVGEREPGFENVEKDIYEEAAKSLAKKKPKMNPQLYKIELQNAISKIREKRRQAPPTPSDEEEEFEDDGR